MIKKILLLAGCMALSACSNAGPDIFAPEQSFSDAIQMESYSGGEAKQAAQADQSSAPVQATQSFMAYRYNYGYVLPAKSVAATANAHMQICLDAGPAKCEVISSNTQSRDETYETAYLSIRGEPKWLESYKEKINKSVEEAKGKLNSSSIDAEDLTRAILDTDARLKAKKTLRDRLESHLETRDAKLADLLALERELSRVQGEIESITSNLNVLKKRVSKSIVNMSYQSKSVAVSRGTFSPVTEAFKDFFRNFAWALGAVITFFAAFLPWLVLVILPLIWFVRWLWRRWRRNPKPKKVKS